MIKQIAWNTFKKTGDINTYLELKQVSNIEENIEKNAKQNIDEKVENYEISKDQGNSDFRT